MAKQRFNRKSRTPGKKNNRQSATHTGERVKPNDHILINEFLFRRGESSLAAEIVTFFSDHEGRRLRSLDLALALGYTESKQLPGFWYVLHKLQEEGAVDKDSDRCYGLSALEESTYEEHLVHVKPFPLPGKAHYTVSKSYTGHISTHPNGYGFVDVEGFDDGRIFLDEDRAVVEFGENRLVVSPKVVHVLDVAPELAEFRDGLGLGFRQ